MKPLDPDLLYYYHNSLTIVMVCLWIVFSFIGYKIQNKYIVYKITYGLIIFSVLQEILDYVNRIFLDELYVLSFTSDLPLQFCSIGYYFSLFFNFPPGNSHNPPSNPLFFLFAISNLLSLKISPTETS